MMKYFKDVFKKVPRQVWIFSAILLVGIILRTYQHHDWLRFNADQGRDAELVSSVVDGTAPLPLLGPKAGGTEFKLGPAFYYFEIASAKIFGNAPDRMAYPDLVTSILCIPLLFLFLHKYFDTKTALASVAVFAVSSYAISYSRFAWNPNSTPFWTILSLFAIHEIIREKDNRKFLWAAVAGIAIGIGVQLHTMLLLLLPITTILVFGYLALRKKSRLKYFFIILVMSLLINVPQLVHEYQTNGENFKAFFGAIKTKQQTQRSILDNALRGSSCWVQGNTDIISGYEISDSCSFDPGKSFADALVFVIGIVFVAGGIILGLRYLLKEDDVDRKSFLAIIFVFTGIAYLIFTKIAFELSMRFYLVLIFLPFLLLGFWIKFFKEKIAMRHVSIPVVAMATLVCLNLFFIQKSFVSLADYGTDGGGDPSVVILKEVEVFSQFIVANSNGAKEAYLDGDGKLLFKAGKSIEYLAGRSRLTLLLVDKKSQATGRYFYLGTSNDRERLLGDADVKVLRYETYGSSTILLLQSTIAPKQ